MLAVFLRPRMKPLSSIGIIGTPALAGILRAIFGWIVGKSFVELAIESRAADFQAAGDLRHLSAIMRKRKTDDLVVHLLQRSHLAGGGAHRKRALGGQGGGGYFATRNKARRVWIGGRRYYQCPV